VARGNPRADTENASDNARLLPANALLAVMMPRNARRVTLISWLLAKFGRL
jgi:hypothetical protein